MPEAVKETKKRPGRPGMVRVMVSITEANHSRLEELAKLESPVYPREVNEFLSILIDRNFATLTKGDAPKQGSLLP